MLFYVLILVSTAAAQLLNGHINPLWLSGSASGVGRSSRLLGPSSGYLNPTSGYLGPTSSLISPTSSGLLYLDDSGRLRPVLSNSRLLLDQANGLDNNYNNNFRSTPETYLNNYRTNYRNGYTTGYRNGYSTDYRSAPDIYPTQEIPYVQSSLY